MKPIYDSFITILLLFSTIFSLHAKKETEFWLTFGQNSNSTYSQVDLQIRIVSGNKPTTGIIHFTNLGQEASVPFSMVADTVFTYSLNNTQKQAVYNTTTGISDKSIYITSSEPVKVYALNQRPYVADATNIFPVEVLDNNYYQISYTVLALSAPDAYAVVAVQDNTQLFHDGEYVEMLNKGEVYYKRSTTDMTGNHITANNPVAFFVLHTGTHVPIGVGVADPFFQQLPPVITWGKNFFVPVSYLGKDRVRIVASQNATTIETDGIFIYSSSGNYTINAGQYIELEVHLSNSGCFIQADKPVGVCTYLTGGGYNPFLVSDPAIAWLSPIEQYYSKAIVAPFYPTGNSYLTAHYALVVTPTATRNDTKVSIGSAPPESLSGGTWHEHSLAGYSFYNMPLADNIYQFTNNKGLIVMGYGTGGAESYYYLAGSAMRELDAAFYANDIHFQDLEENPFCENEVTFRAEIENMGVDVDSIKWYINGTEYEQARDSLEWHYTFDNIGEYEIRMWARFNNDTISKTGTLRIKNCELDTAFYANDVNLNLIDTTFCNKTVSFITYIEGLNTTQDSIKWYIDFGDGIGFVEHLPAQNQKQWIRDFPTGEYPIKMWARLENNDEIEITGTLRIEVLWIKIRNVRY